MPTYDYACSTCDERFEALLSFKAPPPACPACGADATERLLTSFATASSSSQRSSSRLRAVMPGVRSAAGGGHQHSGGCCGTGNCD